MITEINSTMDSAGNLEIISQWQLAEDRLCQIQRLLLIKLVRPFIDIVCDFQASLPIVTMPIIIIRALPAQNWRFQTSSYKHYFNNEIMISVTKKISKMSNI